MRRAGITICAPITGPGLAAVSVVRVSGSLVKDVLEVLVKKSDQVIAQPRAMVWSVVWDKKSGKATVLDEALIAYFPGPNSFTGEDVVEFNLHGSAYVVERLLKNLAHLGVKSALPGEFSERAYFNGRLDLTQAEAIADLIAAETEAQARVATEQLQGKLGSAIDELGEPLRNMLAELEAYIDFPDEEVPAFASKAWLGVLSDVEQKIAKYIGSYSTGKLYRDGARVALVGRPNAGKSSLLNAFVGEDKAIVTPIPGTTRDSIEERISLRGLYVRLWDTAGLVEEHEARRPDEIEVIGIERSWKRAKDADVVVFVSDATGNSNEELPLIEKVAKICPKVIMAWNKVDLCSPPPLSNLSFERCATVNISAKNGDGLDLLRDALYETLLSTRQNQSALVITNERHVTCLTQAQEAIQNAISNLQNESILEIVSIEARAALRALEEIVGVTSSEELLGRIFSKFCIGK